MTAVGFEPTQLALVELESTTLRPLGQTVLATFPEKLVVNGGPLRAEPGSWHTWQEVFGTMPGEWHPKSARFRI